MKKLILNVLLLAVAQSAYALEVAGVSLADRVELAGQSLQLNGAGVRKKLVFDVYVAGLYLPQKNTEAAALLSQKGNKRLVLSMLRTVDAPTLVQSLKDGLKANLSAAQLANYSGKIAELEKILLEAKVAKEGDVVVLDFVAGQGSKIQFKNTQLGVVAGDDFARDLLLIWLGTNPVQADLKVKLLGR